MASRMHWTISTDGGDSRTEMMTKDNEKLEPKKYKDITPML